MRFGKVAQVLLVILSAAVDNLFLRSPSVRQQQ